MDMNTSVANQAQEIMVPLSKLRLSACNARKPHKSDKTEGSRMSLGALASSILHLGVVQNLVVTRGEKDMYEVEAGGRRLRALETLVKGKKIEADYPVRCLLVPADAGLEISLTENVMREEMHPADEFAAFKLLVDEGQTVEDVAAKFGVAPLVVRRRMKLANVSPKLLKAFRESTANLDQLMALSICDDHGRQEDVFFKAHDWQRSAQHLRDLLTEGDVDASTDAVALFVGVETYQAAGGASRADLFATDGKGMYFCDRVLLDKLACDKLVETVEMVKAEGWAWVEIALRLSSGDSYNWTRVQPDRREATPEETESMQKLNKQIDSLYRKSSNEDDDDVRDKLNDQRESLQGQLNVIEDGLRVYAQKYLPLCGALIVVTRDGVKIERGMVRDCDAKKIRALEKNPSGKDSGSGEATEAPASLSESLTRRLTAHRTVAMQIELARRPDVALAVVVHTLILRTFERFTYVGDSVAKITLKPQLGLSGYAPEIEQCAASKELLVLRGTLGSELPACEDDKLLPLLLTKTQEELLNLLALCTAWSLDAVQSRDTERKGLALAKGLGLDMARWWTATADSYFNHVSKARTLEAVKEFAPAEMESLTGLKKGELAAAAERLAAASHWLPQVLR